MTPIRATDESDKNDKLNDVRRQLIDWAVSVHDGGGRVLVDQEKLRAIAKMIEVEQEWRIRRVASFVWTLTESHLPARIVRNLMIDAAKLRSAADIEEDDLPYMSSVLSAYDWTRKLLRGSW